jgi:hypothetical protein
VTVPSFFRRKREQPAAPEPVEPVQPPPPAAGADSDESSPLAARLRTMDWPAAPDDVRERCLREILNRVGDPEPEDEQRDADSGADSRHAAG